MRLPERVAELDAVLSVLSCPTVGAPVVPVLHLSYQEVWLARLGYSRKGYLSALGETLDGLVE